MTKRPKTAGELMKHLESDSVFRAERAAREAKLAELEARCAADERDLVSEIRAHGYDIDSVWDLVDNAPHPVLERRFIGSYQAAYSTLVAHLRLPHHRRVREGVIRALTVKDGDRAVEGALLDEFQTETDPELKWVLANALRTAMPYHQRRKYPEIRETLSRGMTDRGHSLTG